MVRCFIHSTLYVTKNWHVNSHVLCIKLEWCIAHIRRHCLSMTMCSVLRCGLHYLIALRFDGVQVYHRVIYIHVFTALANLYPHQCINTH